MVRVSPAELGRGLDTYSKNYASPLRGQFCWNSILLLESKRSRRQIAALMLDIDYFKQINDNFGHEARDQVLGKYAEVLRSSTRATDFVARYGGEEFVVLLSDTPSADVVVATAE